eukprot:1363829-Rhodomonas_salina.4
MSGAERFQIRSWACGSEQIKFTTQESAGKSPNSSQCPAPEVSVERVFEFRDHNTITYSRPSMLLCTHPVFTTDFGAQGQRIRRRYCTHNKCKTLNGIVIEPPLCTTMLVCVYYTGEAIKGRQPALTRKQ